MTTKQKFIISSAATALIVEFQFNLLATYKLGNLISTIFFYPLYALLIYYLSRYLERLISGWRLEVSYYLLFGLIGLSFEWFVIGNSPWGNPQASQLGQWSFWVAVVLVPRIMINSQISLQLKKTIRRYLTVYTLVGVMVGLIGLVLLPPPARVFWPAIVQIWFFTGLHYFYWQYWRQLANNKWQLTAE